MSATTTTNRITSLDLVRGAVMVLMAIDHVRVYSGVPAGGPSAGIFFTRWFTHFCAPAFALLAGTGAYLHARQLGDPARLARYLVTRGALLVVLELTVIRWAWTFNADYSDFLLCGVIWMLGWCMILMAGLVRFSTRTIATIGLFLIVFQQAFHFVPRILPEAIRDTVGWLWEFVYPAGLETPSNLAILYVLVPWVGVMAAGYAFGAIVTREPAERRRLCLRIGLSATALFAVISGFVAFRAPADGDGPPALFRALNPPKYPVSQMFLLMTLGPTIALLPFLEGARGRIADVLTTFGRVPMFYYLLHIPAIHVAALIVTFAREGSLHPEWYAQAPFTSVPDEQRWGLPLLYLVFVLVVAVLYVPCRWFAAVKARGRAGWLRYL